MGLQDTEMPPGWKLQTDGVLFRAVDTKCISNFVTDAYSTAQKAVDIAWHCHNEEMKRKNLSTHKWVDV